MVHQKISAIYIEGSWQSQRELGRQSDVGTFEGIKLHQDSTWTRLGSVGVNLASERTAVALGIECIRGLQE